MHEITLFERAKKELGFDVGGNLRSVNDVRPHDNLENSALVSEWLSLETAKRLGADFVYFRRFDNSPSHPLIYIFDYSNKSGIPDDHNLGEIQKNIWSSGEVPCTFIFSKESLRILNTTRSPQQKNDGFSPVYLLKLAQEITEEIKQRFSVYELNSGAFWEQEAANFAYDQSAHQTLLSKLKNVREQLIKSEVFGKNIHLINRLLIQCVLIRFLEEKKDYDETGKELKVFPSDFFQKYAQANSFKEAVEKGTFIQIFNYLNNPKNLNGKIFEWTKEEQDILLKIPSAQLVKFLYQTDTDANAQKRFGICILFVFYPSR